MAMNLSVIVLGRCLARLYKITRPKYKVGRPNSIQGDLKGFLAQFDSSKLRELKEYSESTGISASEVLRQLLDQFLDSKKYESYSMIKNKVLHVPLDRWINPAEARTIANIASRNDDQERFAFSNTKKIYEILDARTKTKAAQKFKQKRFNESFGVVDKATVTSVIPVID